MILLNKSLQAWTSDRFKAVLKDELEALPHGQLPLQQRLRFGNYVLDERPGVMVLASEDVGHEIALRIGVFYRGIIAGCSCADDPTPVEPVNEYCELNLRLDKSTAMATVSPVEE